LSTIIDTQKISFNSQKEAYESFDEDLDYFLYFRFIEKKTI